MNKIRSFLIVLTLISVVAFTVPVSAQERPVTSTLLASLAQVLDSIRLQLLALQQEVDTLEGRIAPTTRVLQIITPTTVATATPIFPPGPSPSPSPGTPNVNASLDPSSPPSHTVIPGQTNVLFTVARLSVSGGSPSLNGVQVAAGPLFSVINVKVYVGITLVGTLPVAGMTWIYFTPIVLPANTNQLVYMYADIATSSLPTGSANIALTGLNFLSPGANVSGLPVIGNGMSIVLPPNAPTNLFSSSTTPTSVTLVWQDNSNNEDSFEIQRLTSPSTFFAHLATTTVNATTYTDTTVSPNTSYVYRVRAYNAAGGYSAFSNGLSLTTPPAPSPPPVAPLYLSAAALPTPLIATSSRPVLLTWIDTYNETYFVIEKSTNGVTFFQSQSIITSGTINDYPWLFLLDWMTTPNTNYWYRVRAGNAAGLSLPSNVFQVLTPP